MTFQGAKTVIYASYAYTPETINKAVSAIKFFEDNVLELEDHETDELFKVLDYIQANDLGGEEVEEAENKQVILTESQLSKIGSELYTIMRTIQMQNDIIDGTKNPADIDEDHRLFELTRIYRAQDNIFYLNQDIIEKLDTYSTLLSSSTEQDEVNAMLKTL